MAKTTENAIPNELFSYELKKRHWTEVYVAVQIGVPDKNTVGRWKRGEAVPSDYYKEKLVELFGKGIDKLGWSDENKVPNSNLDYHPPTPLFTGREDTLNWIHNGSALRGRYELLSVQALTGLSGVGKSQIASKYAHTFKHEYHTIMWLRAENSAVLASDFAAIASHVGLAEQYEINQKKRIDTVIRWLTHKDITRWLLIFDSADEPEVLKEILERYIPRPCQGHVIITTRSNATGEIEHRKEVNPFSIEESAHFLLRRTKKLPSEANIKIAKAIAEELGGLPLALEQAGAYIDETGCGLRQYLDLYQTKARKKLLTFKGKLTVYPHSPIAITLSLAFEQVQKVNPIAIDLLFLFAFLAPNDIPEELVSKAALALSPALHSIAEQPDLLDEAMAELNKYSLVRRYPDSETCSIHPLVQTCMKDTMAEETQKLWAEYAIKAINQIAPTPTNLTWTSFERYYSHAQQCIFSIRQWNTTSLEAGNILRITGVYIGQHGHYKLASQLLQKALDIYNTVFDDDPLKSAQGLNDLADCHIQLGNYDLAEDIYELVLNIRGGILGTMSHMVSATAYSLAECYREQLKDEQAEPLYQLSIEIDNNTLDANDPARIPALSGLGTLYIDYLRDIEVSQVLFEKVQELLEHNGMQDNPEAVRFYNQLARFFTEQGKYAVAEAIFLHTLALSETLELGHPEVGRCCNYLAELYIAINKYDEAEKFALRALAINENANQELKINEKAPVVRPNDIINALTTLGFLRGKQGKYDQAISLYQWAITIQLQTFGENDRRIVIICANLSWIFQKQNRLLEAKPLFQIALHNLDMEIGVQYVDRVSYRKDYISLLLELEEYEEAVKQYLLLPYNDRQHQNLIGATVLFPLVDKEVVSPNDTNQKK